MTGIVWIERGGDGWYLRVHPSDQYPAGRSVVLQRYTSLDDPASLAEIDDVVREWGWRREGIGYLDDMGAMQIPVAPASR